MRSVSVTPCCVAPVEPLIKPIASRPDVIGDEPKLSLITSKRLFSRPLFALTPSCNVAPGANTDVISLTPAPCALTVVTPFLSVYLVKLSFNKTSIPVPSYPM